MKKPSRRKILIGSGSLIGLSGCAGRQIEKDSTISVEKFKYLPKQEGRDILISTKDENNVKATVEYANYYEYYNTEKETEWKNETDITLSHGWQNINKHALQDIIPKEEPVTFKFTAGDKELVLDNNYYMFAYEKNNEVKITDPDILKRKVENKFDIKWKDIEENFVSKTESDGEIKYKLVGHIPRAIIEPDHPQKYNYIKENLSEVHINPYSKTTFYPYIVEFSIDKQNKKDLREVIESDTIMWKDFKKSVRINEDIGKIKYYQRKTFDTLANQIIEYTKKYRNICGKRNTNQLDLRILHGIFGTQVEYKRKLPLDNGKYSVIFPFQLFDIQVADCSAQSFFMMGVAHELGYDVSTLILERKGVAGHAEPAALIENPDYDFDSSFYGRDNIITYRTDADKHSSITVEDSIPETSISFNDYDSLWGINYLEAS